MNKEQALKRVAKAGHRLPEDPILTKRTGSICPCGAELAMLGNSWKFFPSYLVCPACGTITLMPWGGMPNLKKHTKEELGVE